MICWEPLQDTETRGESGDSVGATTELTSSSPPFCSFQPAAHLQEDFPLVASYLRTITNEPAPIPSASDTIDEDDEDEELDQGEDGEGEDEDEDADMSAELSADNLSSLMAERLTEDQTSLLMEQFAEVMRKCEEDGINRDEELKQSEFARGAFLPPFLPSTPAAARTIRLNLYVADPISYSRSRLQWSKLLSSRPSTLDELSTLDRLLLRRSQLRNRLLEERETRGREWSLDVRHLELDLDRHGSAEI